VKDLVDLGIVLALLFYHNTADRRDTFKLQRSQDIDEDNNINRLYAVEFIIVIVPGIVVLTCLTCP